MLILNFHALYFRSLVQFFFVSWGDREFNLLPRKVILVCEAWWSLSLCILYLPWCRIFWTKYRESERSFFFFLFQGFMSLWCGNLVGVAISSSTSFCGPFMKTLVKHCYTFLNIAIFIIIAVDPKWRATSSSLLFKTFSNLVKKMMSISKLDRKGIWKIDFSFLS